MSRGRRPCRRNCAGAAGPVTDQGPPRARRAVAAVLSAALGIWKHVYANYDAGPLDQRYDDTWESLPEARRWWLALTKSVGPSPPLAPAALA